MARLIEITEGRKVYKATEELIKEAKEKGVSPCKICKKVSDPGKCSAPNCYAWSTWFADRWRRIRKAARMKGYNV